MHWSLFFWGAGVGLIDLLGAHGFLAWVRRQSPGDKDRVFSSSNPSWRRARLALYLFAAAGVGVGLMAGLLVGPGIDWAWTVLVGVHLIALGLLAVFLPGSVRKAAATRE